MFSDKPETRSESFLRTGSVEQVVKVEQVFFGVRIAQQLISYTLRTHSLTLHSLPDIAVVAQYYEADVNKEHVIRGNSAVIKCLIPSFVADFVEVVSWHTDQDENYFPGTEYGAINSATTTSSTLHSS